MRASRRSQVRFLNISSRVMPMLVVGTFCLVMSVPSAAAQPATPAAPSEPQQQQQSPPKPAATQPADHSQMGHDAMPGAREGSGTSWLPDASLMYAIHSQRGQWQFMAHGNGFLQYLDDGGDRGSDQVGSINWVMGMAERTIGTGRLAFRGMFSVEPFTIGGCGYPDLLATGERCNGEPIHDRQHQHDLFMEAAAMYDGPLSGGLRWQIYGGPAGEPALGPVAYPHRISAMPNLLAPITHHWLDATHITFGVVTAGVYGTRWKAEASAFNGREPDEERTGLDLAPLDSFSARVWYLPTSNLAMQLSGGRLNEAEPGEEGGPRVDVSRLTASATYHRLRDEDGIWASTVAWGRNAESGRATHALLLETNLTLRDRDSWFGRFEIAGKTAHDLDVPTSVVHDVEGEQVFTVSKLQAGYTRYFDAWQDLRPGIGFTASLSFVPRALESFYGDRMNPGVGIYLTVRPAAMPMTMAHGMTAAPPPAPAREHPTAKPAPDTPRPPADPHAGHAAPATAMSPPQPAAAAPVPPKTADPHAGHPTTAPAAKPAAKPEPKAADAHAAHKPAPKPLPKPPAKPAEPHKGHDVPSDEPVAMSEDPKKLVCSPTIDPDNAPSTTYKGKRYYFCSNAERLRFLLNPETYLKSRKGSGK